MNQSIYIINNRFGETVTKEDEKGVLESQIQTSRDSEITASTIDEEDALAALQSEMLQKRSRDSSPEIQYSIHHLVSKKYVKPVVKDPLRDLKFKGPTDAKNPEFLESLKNRTFKNYIKPNEELSKSYKEKAKKELEEYQEECNNKPEIYVYSGQKLQSSELQRKEMYKRLMQDPTATYTYSKDYPSQTIQLGSMESLTKLENKEENKKWITPEGFILDAKLPPFSKVSAARAEELAAGFADEDDLPVDERGGHVSTNGRPEMDLSFVPPQYFGGFKEGKIIDGRLIPSNEKDPDYTRSVFLSGESMIREQREYEENMKKEWLEKVVVDDIEFKPYIPFGEGAQADKCGDILADPPKKLSLKMVRNVKLPSGKYCPLRPPPKTIFADGQFSQPDFTFRDDPSPDTFVGINKETGKPVDFELDISQHKFIYTRDITKLKPEEIKGPKWRNETIKNLDKC